MKINIIQRAAWLSVLVSCLLTNGYSQPGKQKKKQEIDYVNPIIGTPFAGFDKDLQGGGTMPTVGLPYAMTNFVLQTHENKMSRMPYIYEDSTVIGFMATHQPTVWMGDYGYLSVMPEVGELKLLPENRALPFSHKSEIATPYYYSVQLQAGNKKQIRGEITAASRCGLFRFTFPKSDQSHIVLQGINLNPALADNANSYDHRIKTLRGYVKVDKENGEITGYNPDRQSAQLGPELPNFKGYFVIQFSKPFDSFGTWSGQDVHPSSTEQYGTRMGAYISFSTRNKEQVMVRVATSFISIEQARENLKREIPDWNFDQLAIRTRNTWQENLSRVQVSHVSEAQKTIFYTALFHTMLFPREFSEYGKYYSAFDDKIHAGVSYTDYSLWDTFRALHPLLIFTQPERVNDMISSLLQMYQQGGWLPMWPNPAETNIMIGTHADAVIADAYVKGFRGFDSNLAYEAIRKDAMVPPDCDTKKLWGDRDLWTSNEVRGGLSYYHSLGYVPVDKTSESVSRTIEYSFDDYCVSVVAKEMGKTDDYNRLKAWSNNYKNVFNPQTGFFGPRKFDGTFNDPEHEEEGFTEGDKWTYAFGAMQDPAGMIELMGGNEKFAAKLDSNFSGHHYHHDNEPGHHYIYIYDYCGQPWKTQELVRTNTRINYLDQPLGINGNDDCGQMSAWYLFGVMGFYPVTPGSGMYAIGAPQFPQIILHYKSGNENHQLEIVAKNLSEENKYVQRVSLDGKTISSPFIRHTDLINAKNLVFEMGPRPNYNWK
jgi:predicted alpha-1,2-mannosidase